MLLEAIFCHLRRVNRKERDSKTEKEPVSHAGQGLTHFHVACKKQREPLMAVM